MEIPFDQLQKGQTYMYENRRSGTTPRRVKIVDIMRMGPSVAHVMQTNVRTDGVLTPWEMVPKRSGLVYKRVSGGTRRRRNQRRRNTRRNK